MTPLQIDAHLRLAGWVPARTTGKAQAPCYVHPEFGLAIGGRYTGKSWTCPKVWTREVAQGYLHPKAMKAVLDEATRWGKA